MSTERTFDCEFCGATVTTTDPRKRYCSKKHADRARGQVRPAGEVLAEALKPVELQRFSKLSIPQKEALLRGDYGHKIVMYDIEATHLKPNVGRILCCSFKPLGGKVYTFHGHQKRYMKADTFDDRDLARDIITELEKYDIIVGWNSKNFDTKFINSRAIRNGGGRAKNAQYHVDAMWSWRSKMSAWSKLDTAQRFIAPELETTKTSIEWDKWMQALGWNKKLRDAAMAEIIEHCEIDVTVLEEVYLRMIEANTIRSIRRDGGVL